MARRFSVTLVALSMSTADSHPEARLALQAATLFTALAMALKFIQLSDAFRVLARRTPSPEVFWMVPPVPAAPVPVTVSPAVAPVLFSTMPLVPPLAAILRNTSPPAPMVVLATFSATPPTDVIVLFAPVMTSVPPEGPTPALALMPPPVVVATCRAPAGEADGGAVLLPDEAHPGPGAGADLLGAAREADRRGAVVPQRDPAAGRGRVDLPGDRHRPAGLVGDVHCQRRGVGDGAGVGERAVPAVDLEGVARGAGERVRGRAERAVGPARRPRWPGARC